MMNQKAPPKWLIILAFAAIYIIWGSTYLAILVALENIPPFIMSAIRFLIAGIVLFSWCLYKNQGLPTFKNVFSNSLSGILMLVGGTVSVVWAEQYLPTGILAIFVTTLPFWFVLLDKKQWPSYFSNKAIPAGLCLGFAGILLLLGMKPIYHPSSVAMQITAAVAALTGTILWAIGSLFSKYKPTGLSTTMNVSIQLIAAGICCLLLSIISGEQNKFRFTEVTTSSWLALLYLTVMGSLVAYMAYIWLLTVRPPALVGTYAYVNPAIAILLGSVFANEEIQLLQVIALVVILTGVFLVNVSKYKTKKNDNKNLAWKNKS